MKLLVTMMFSLSLLLSSYVMAEEKAAPVAPKTKTSATTEPEKKAMPCEHAKDGKCTEHKDGKPCEHAKDSKCSEHKDGKPCEHAKDGKCTEHKDDKPCEHAKDGKCTCHDEEKKAK